MKTTTLSSARFGEAVTGSRRTSAKNAVQLIVMLAVDAALLLGGVRLTGFAWQDLCFLLVPPMVAGAGTTAIGLPQGHADAQTWVKIGPGILK
jgi:hypothetical protein